MLSASSVVRSIQAHPGVTLTAVGVLGAMTGGPLGFLLGMVMGGSVIGLSGMKQTYGFAGESPFGTEDPFEGINWEGAKENQAIFFGAEGVRRSMKRTGTRV